MKIKYKLNTQATLYNKFENLQEEIKLLMNELVFEDELIIKASKSDISVLTRTIISELNKISFIKNELIKLIIETNKHLDIISFKNGLFDYTYLKRKGFLKLDLISSLKEEKPIKRDKDPFSYLGKHRTHYLKWVYIGNEDISIRYFFSFQDDKQKEGEFFWKSHSKKIYKELTRTEAELMLKNMGFEEKPLEIIGYEKKGKYKKVFL